MTELHSFNIKIAELNIRMFCKYPFVKRLCSEFCVDSDAWDITASVTDEQIKDEKAQTPDTQFSDGYCEGICLYRDIAEKMPRYDGLVFHGASVSINGKGCIFTARSGTGKTTHIKLLMNKYPDNVKIINGDKPIIRRVDGEWRIYSTPWAGKEGMLENTSAPLSSIVIVERGETNSIEKISPGQYFDTLMGQVYIPVDGESMLMTYDLLDDMSGKVEFYRLRCNMETEAADTSYSALADQM